MENKTLHSNNLLRDTSLCTIVRDERMNPAGGIRRFVEAHVPFVEEAVIIDTGSIDGTREILEDLKKDYSNLRIIDLPFLGFATTRNNALKYVRTKRALILDADELLTSKTPENDWEKINNVINNFPSPYYKFRFSHIPFGNEKTPYFGGHNVRLLDSSISDPFEEELWERIRMKIIASLYSKNSGKDIFPLDIYIKHFLPPKSSLKIKRTEWYLDSIDGVNSSPTSERLDHWKNAPSTCENFPLWKRYNPKRKNYT